MLTAINIKGIFMFAAISMIGIICSIISMS